MTALFGREWVEVSLGKITLFTITCDLFGLFAF